MINSQKIILDSLYSIKKIHETLFENTELINKISLLAEQIYYRLEIKNNKLLLAGNGGSFSDCAHMAGELIGKYKSDRKPLACINLGQNGVAMTAIANDYDYTDVICREFDALAKDGDILIVLSTSGNSKNILKLIEIAKKKKIDIFALTGQEGGQLAKMLNYENILFAPSSVTARIQELHIIIFHLLCEIIDSKILNNSSYQ